MTIIYSFYNIGSMDTMHKQRIFLNIGSHISKGQNLSYD